MRAGVCQLTVSGVSVDRGTGAVSQIGAVITALLLTVGKSLIGTYIGRSGVASVFGAAGSLVIFLLWVYYSAQVFLLGAEFTRVFTQRHDTSPAERTPVP